MDLQALLKLKRATNKPLVYCLCGSTDKAQEAFQGEMLRLTLEGHIVLSIGANEKDRALSISPEQKIQLDILHLYKIDLADIVRILNVKGYIGESTQRELEYAMHALSKGRLQAIEFLEPVLPPGVRACSGCASGWCEGCVPDETVLEPISMLTPPFDSHPIHTGDTVRLIGTEETYEVEAVDPHFEGEGLAVGIWLPATKAIEMIDASLVELVEPDEMEEEEYDDTPQPNNNLYGNPYK